MAKIKIFHVFHSLNMGGLENGVVNLVNRSNAEFFSHEICCLSTSGVVSERLEVDIPIFDMHKREGNDWRMILQLIRLIKSRQPNIVHTRNWGGVDAIAAAAIAGVSTIIHSEHGWNLDDPRGQNYRRRQIRRLFSFPVSHFVAVSADIKDWLIDDVGVKKDKIRVIFNGVDTEKFLPGDQPYLKERYGFLPSDCIIGSVGRFDPIKNHQLLLKAFSRLNCEGKTIRLVFLGDGPERNSLIALRDSLPCRDRIHFLGQRDDVADILRIMDIFVLPSKSEGVCNALLEAMATGLPIVATAVGGNIELIQDGFTGLLVPSDDEHAMSNALVRLIEDESGLRSQIGAKAREMAEEKFSLLRMVSEYESLYLSTQPAS